MKVYVVKSLENGMFGLPFFCVDEQDLKKKLVKVFDMIDGFDNYEVFEIGEYHPMYGIFSLLELQARRKIDLSDLDDFFVQYLEKMRKFGLDFKEKKEVGCETE